MQCCQRLLMSSSVTQARLNGPSFSSVGMRCGEEACTCATTKGSQARNPGQLKTDDWNRAAGKAVMLMQHCPVLVSLAELSSVFLEKPSGCVVGGLGWLLLAGRGVCGCPPDPGVDGTVDGSVGFCRSTTTTQRAILGRVVGCLAACNFQATLGSQRQL